MSTIPLKRIANIIAGQSPASDDVDPYDGGQPFLQGNAEFGALAPKPRWQCSVASKVARPGDVLLSVRAPVGAVNVADQRYGIGRGLCAVRPNSFAREYLWWYLQSQTAALRSVATGSTFEAVSAADVGSLSVPALAPEQMSAIASFLDRETAKIDALINKQEQLIATLREDRAATITQAVTKGLDQSVEFQYTGIAVMDAIPSHWSLRKLKHLAGSFEQGVSPQASAELATEGWGVLKSGCVNGGVFRDIEHKKLPQDFEFDGRLAVAVGDLLVCRASGSPNLVGSAAIVQKLGYQLILSDKIFRLTPNRRSSLDYLEWALNARPYREQVLGAISGAEGLANNLPLSLLRNFWFAVPPIAEQQEIARFLGERCTKIDTLIAKSTEMIETLREYRSALITNAVTGKIDVREAV